MNIIDRIQPYMKYVCIVALAVSVYSGIGAPPTSLMLLAPMWLLNAIVIIYLFL